MSPLLAERRHVVLDELDLRLPVIEDHGDAVHVSGRWRVRIAIDGHAVDVLDVERGFPDDNKLSHDHESFLNDEHLNPRTLARHVRADDQQEKEEIGDDEQKRIQ